MRFVSAPVLTRQAAVCIALISRPYVIQEFFVGLTVMAVSDSAAENGNGSDVRTEEERVLHHLRLTFRKVARNKNLWRLGVLLGFAEILCYCCKLFSCIDSSAGGAIHMMFGRVCLSFVILDWNLISLHLGHVSAAIG